MVTLALGAALAVSPAALAAQQSVASVASVASDTAPAACPRTAPPHAPTADQRRAARDLAARAQEAAIVSNDSTARDLYERAARLDPTDPAIAYALARSYESARDARAIGEYCRFLALQPAAPEAADVRRRVAALTFELTPHSANRPAAPPSPPAPGAALAYGIVFPGGGQYYTHRPALGLLVTAATAGALYYGFQQHTTTVMLTATDPNGKVYQYPAPRTERSNLAAGVGAAAAISFLAAIEASSHARAAQRVAAVARTAMVAPAPHALLVGLRLSLSTVALGR